MTEVWIADDDQGIRFVLHEALSDSGIDVREFGDAQSLLDALEHSRPDVVVSDVRMPGTNGLELLEKLKHRGVEAPVIVISAFTDVASTVAAYRNGAFDYLPKPFDLDQMAAAVERALAETRSPPPQPEAELEQELIGQSPAMREIFRNIGRIAATELNVLVTGDTGTGKELVARALHCHSTRATRPFVAMNTAAVPSELLESELFGHEAGAFTGALKRHAGRFEQAHGGTLFLDEIGDMPLMLQTRLLRVLAEDEFYRVGGRELLRADVRIVAATHQDLDAKVTRGEFRADLLHRLDVVRLHLPPLDQRREDIPLLATRFLTRAATEMNLQPKYFSPTAREALTRLSWPGNIRQLENLCRRLAVMAPGREIRSQDLPNQDSATDQDPSGWRMALQRLVQTRLADGENDIYTQLRDEFDQSVLAAALTQTDNHRGRAAQRLGLGRNTLTRKLGSSRPRRSKPHKG